MFRTSDRFVVCCVSDLSGKVKVTAQGQIIFSIQSCPSHNFLTTEENSMKRHSYVQDIKKCVSCKVPDCSCKVKVKAQGHSFSVYWKYNLVSAIPSLLLKAVPCNFLITEENFIEPLIYVQDIKNVNCVRSSESQLHGQGHSSRLFPLVITKIVFRLLLPTYWLLIHETSQLCFG